MINSYKVLSIDAWGNSDEGYEWNAWYSVGTIDIDLEWSTQKTLQAMHDAGYITQIEGGDIEDDQYNLVVVDHITREPLFAIEYGNTI